MKKLMIAAAIVCAAAMSQAATVLWDSGDVYEGAIGDKVADGDNYLQTGTGYLFVMGIGQGESIAQAAADWATLTTAADIWGAFDASTETLTVNGHAYTAKVADVDDGLIEWGASDGINKGDKAYAAVIVTSTSTSGDDMYTASAFSSATATESGFKSDGVAGNWFADGVKGEATTWQAAVVPEPTSGLLLLLGVAGLALRRRRA